MKLGRGYRLLVIGGFFADIIVSIVLALVAEAGKRGGAIRPPAYVLLPTWLWVGAVFTVLLVRRPGRRSTGTGFARAQGSMVLRGLLFSAAVIIGASALLITGPAAQTAWIVFGGSVAAGAIVTLVGNISSVHRAEPQLSERK